LEEDNGMNFKEAESMAKFYERYTHERNYGCRVKEYVYRGLKTVTMENELIRVSILVDKGTDIFEFLYKPKDIDFMWHSFNGIKSPASFVAAKEHPGGPFLDYYEGGWQELFPNISDDCVYMGAPLGMHGEVCLTPWEYRIIEDRPEEISVRFWIRTNRMPYYLEKTLSMKTEDSTLYIDERVVNEGSIELQFMWGHHPAFGPLFLDENCVMDMPENCKAKTYWVDLGKNAVLPVDTEFKWPLIKGLDEKIWDLSKVPPPDSKVFMMFHLYDIPDGWYRITNTKKEIGFGMKWDKDMFPIIWVWAPYGGAEMYPWYGRNYNLAIEPWSAIPHNLEKLAEQGRGIKIGPGQEIKTSLQATAYVTFP